MIKIKKYTNVIIAVLLVFSIIFTIMSVFVMFVVTNKNIYLNLLQKTNTYVVVEEELYKKMNSILGNDISEEIKKTIITEEDVRKEADIVLNYMLSNAKNGQAIVPNIDTSIYKVRVAQALSSLTGYEIEIDNAAENINVTDSQIYSYDSEYIITPLNVFNNTNGTVRQDLLFENTAYMKSSSFNNDAVIADQIATRAELEAQGRAMLKERGLTESEARKKLAEKGISEAQVWDYLIKNGYLDEEEIDKGLDNSEVSGQIKSDDYAIESEKNQINAEAADNKSNAYNNEENQIIQNESNYSQNDDIKVSKKKIQDIVISVIMDQNTNLEEKMQILSSKLMEEADKIINAEMEKLNFSNIINSDMFKTAVRITSALYNMFYGFIMITLALIFILCIVNKDNLKYSVNIAAKSVMISGVILSLMSGAVYLLKLYEKVEVDFNKVYFESMFISSCDYFSRVLFIISISIFFAGIIINILMIKNRLIRR